MPAVNLKLEGDAADSFELGQSLREMTENDPNGPEIAARIIGDKVVCEALSYTEEQRREAVLSLRYLKAYAIYVLERLDKKA